MKTNNTSLSRLIKQTTHDPRKLNQAETLFTQPEGSTAALRHAIETHRPTETRDHLAQIVCDQFDELVGLTDETLTVLRAQGL